MSFQRHADLLCQQIAMLPFIAELRSLAPDQFAPDTVRVVLEAAAEFAEEVIAPLDPKLDKAGCTLAGGRVVTSEEHRSTWNRFVEAGWTTLTAPAWAGGQELPTTLQSACEELWNRASPAFNMLTTLGQTGVALLKQFPDDPVAKEWIEEVTAGRRALTICISEPDAGSDVGRIRTRADSANGRGWRVSGGKCWISFGDHDLAEQIGHLLIARTNQEPGVRGLSLFLVPDLREDGSRNAISIARIEEKMGLHGSPTCVIDFDAAEAHLLGEEGKGLPQLFAMMLRMRLSVGSQGGGVAMGVSETAFAYSLERRQGGDPREQAVPIGQHADVQRLLLSMFGRAVTASGLTLMTAGLMDLLERTTNEEERASLSPLLQWLLPLVKDFGARTAFDVSNDAIQVLGGAGYTNEWRAEQAARDSRVFSIFEGTSGIQALDLLHRRLWREGGAGFDKFLELACKDVKLAAPAHARCLDPVLKALRATSDRLKQQVDKPREAEAGATALLNLSALAATGWVALRLASAAPNDDHAGQLLSSAAGFYLAELPARAELEAQLALLGSARLASFAELS